MLAAPELIKKEDKLFLAAPSHGLEFCVDYLSSEFQHRLKTVNAGNLLVRAVGAGKERPRIYDLSLGLGYDALQLAFWGCEVWAWERNFTVFQLVEDALRRLMAKNKEVAERISFFYGHARIPEKASVIYFDPMYPSRGKSKPRKELQLLREVVGEDLDAQETFLAAWPHCTGRFVVKRPDKAEPLVDEPKLHHSLEGTTVRFDIYTP